MSCPRVSYRRRMHYATRGNRMKLVRTPGNKLVMQKRRKTSQGIHTPWVLGHKRIGGTKAFHHSDARLESRHRKTVSRAYGGVLSHDQVRDRIVRAFLIEEQRIVKQALAAHAKYQRDKKRAVNKKKKKTEAAKALTKKLASRTITRKPVAKKTPAARVPVGAKLLKK